MRSKENNFEDNHLVFYSQSLLKIIANLAASKCSQANCTYVQGLRKQLMHCTVIIQLVNKCYKNVEHT